MFIEIHEKLDLCALSCCESLVQQSAYLEFDVRQCLLDLCQLPLQDANQSFLLCVLCGFCVLLECQFLDFIPDDRTLLLESLDVALETICYLLMFRLVFLQELFILGKVPLVLLLELRVLNEDLVLVFLHLPQLLLQPLQSASVLAEVLVGGAVIVPFRLQLFFLLFQL